MARESYLGLAMPAASATNWGPGEADDVNENPESVAAILTHHGNLFTVGKDLTTTNVPSLTSASSPRVFDSIQDAVDAAEAAFSGSDQGVVIEILPGVYEDHITLSCDCNITFVGRGYPWSRHGGRNYPQVLITGVEDGGTEAPLVLINPNSSLSAQYTFVNIAFDNREFRGTGSGTKSAANIIAFQPGSSWSGGNGYIRFVNCYFDLTEANSSITWTYGIVYSTANVTNKWGGMFFDGCDFRGDGAGARITNPLFFGTNASQASTYNTHLLMNCRIFVGSLANIFVLNNPYHRVYVEHSSVSSAADICNFTGTTTGQHVYGVTGGTDAGYGQNVLGSAAMSFAV